MNPMNEIIRNQILAIRDTGLTNMFDKDMVQKLAFDREMYELVMFLENNPRDYIKFILFGDGREDDNDDDTPAVDEDDVTPAVAAGAE